MDDAIAKASIKDEWARKGTRAAELGTAIHAWIEAFLGPTCLSGPIVGMGVETEQFLRFMDSDAMRDNVPYKAEMMTWWEYNGRMVAAGTVDALFTDPQGQVWLFDWKRTKKPLDGTDAFNRKGSGPVAHIDDSTLHKYSLQASLYSVMIKQSHNYETGDRMYLVAIHPDRSSYEIVQCVDLRDEALAILHTEYTRLTLLN